MSLRDNFLAYLDKYKGKKLDEVGVFYGQLPFTLKSNDLQLSAYKANLFTIQELNGERYADKENGYPVMFDYPVSVETVRQIKDGDRQIEKPYQRRAISFYMKDTIDEIRQKFQRVYPDDPFLDLSIPLYVTTKYGYNTVEVTALNRVTHDVNSYTIQRTDDIQPILFPAVSDTSIMNILDRPNAFRYSLNYYQPYFVDREHLTWLDWVNYIHSQYDLGILVSEYDRNVKAIFNTFRERYRNTVNVNMRRIRITEPTISAITHDPIWPTLKGIQEKKNYLLNQCVLLGHNWYTKRSSLLVCCAHEERQLSNMDFERIQRDGVELCAWCNEIVDTNLNDMNPFIEGMSDVPPMIVNTKRTKNKEAQWKHLSRYIQQISEFQVRDDQIDTFLFLYSTLHVKNYYGRTIGYRLNMSEMQNKMISMFKDATNKEKAVSDFVLYINNNVPNPQLTESLRRYVQYAFSQRRADGTREVRKNRINDAIAPIKYASRDSSTFLYVIACIYVLCRMNEVSNFELMTVNWEAIFYSTFHNTGDIQFILNLWKAADNQPIFVSIFHNGEYIANWINTLYEQFDRAFKRVSPTRIKPDIHPRVHYASRRISMDNPHLARDDTIVENLYAANLSMVEVINGLNMLNTCAKMTTRKIDGLKTIQDCCKSKKFIETPMDTFNPQRRVQEMNSIGLINRAIYYANILERGLNGQVQLSYNDMPTYNNTAIQNILTTDPYKVKNVSMTDINNAVQQNIHYKIVCQGKHIKSMKDNKYVLNLVVSNMTYAPDLIEKIMAKPSIDQSDRSMEKHDREYNKHDSPRTESIRPNRYELNAFIRCQALRQIIQWYLDCLKGEPSVKPQFILRSIIEEYRIRCMRREFGVNDYKHLLELPNNMTGMLNTFCLECMFFNPYTETSLNWLTMQFKRQTTLYITPDAYETSMILTLRGLNRNQFTMDEADLDALMIANEHEYEDTDVINLNEDAYDIFNLGQGEFEAETNDLVGGIEMINEDEMFY